MSDLPAHLPVQLRQQKLQAGMTEGGGHAGGNMRHARLQLRGQVAGSTSVGGSRGLPRSQQIDQRQLRTRQSTRAASVRLRAHASKKGCATLNLMTQPLGPRENRVPLEPAAPCTHLCLLP